MFGWVPFLFFVKFLLVLGYTFIFLPALLPHLHFFIEGDILLFVNYSESQQKTSDSTGNLLTSALHGIVLKERVVLFYHRIVLLFHLHFIPPIPMISIIMLHWSIKTDALCFLH